MLIQQTKPAAAVQKESMWIDHDRRRSERHRMRSFGQQPNHENRHGRMNRSE